MSCNAGLPLRPGDDLALTEKQQQRLQVCQKNWVSRIAGVKRVDRRRMDDLREEIGVQMSLTGKFVKCRLRWAEHLVRMGEERMAKGADRLMEQNEACIFLDPI